MNTTNPMKLNYPKNQDLVNQNQDLVNQNRDLVNQNIVNTNKNITGTCALQMSKHISEGNKIYVFKKIFKIINLKIKLLYIKRVLAMKRK